MKKEGVQENACAVGPPLLRHDIGPFNVEPYMDDLKDLDITEEQKIEFLQTLCLIMKTFVDIGWGVDSLQRVFPAMIPGAPEEEPASESAQCFNAAAIKSDPQP